MWIPYNCTTWEAPRVCARMCVYTCACVCVCVLVCVCMLVFMYMCVHVCMCVCVFQGWDLASGQEEEEKLNEYLDSMNLQQQESNGLQTIAPHDEGTERGLERPQRGVCKFPALPGAGLGVSTTKPLCLGCAQPITLSPGRGVERSQGGLLIP